MAKTKEIDMLRKAFSSIVVVTLMLALGAGGATGSAKAAQAEQGKPKELVYTHGLVWNRVLPGLAGQLLLTFDVGSARRRPE
jgi:hypothetical protein